MRPLRPPQVIFVIFSRQLVTNHLILLVLCCAITLADQAHGSGFNFTRPPGYVNPQSGRRNHVFYVGQAVNFTSTVAIASYQVRDYYGNLVDQGVGTGPLPQTLTLNVVNPGWYKLYLYGSVDQGSPWGKNIGGTMFVIFRNTANFPALPAVGTSGGAVSAEDEIMRGVTGLGPQRLFVADATNPSQAIAQLQQDIAIDQQMYLPYDPLRKRQLMVAFPNGTVDGNGVVYPGVVQIVQQFKDVVKYWEARNEPNFSVSGPSYAVGEMKAFYQAVKGVDPTLKVLGPAVVSIGPSMSTWINGFLDLGGGNCIDAFSFHAYNCVNGDPWLVKRTLGDLKGKLAAHSQPNLETWQTEQGYMAAVYGSYQPRLQGRWTMLQMMLYEQFGIPKEHNHLWYDVSHGFWTEPMFWENNDGSLNPAAALMRVWSEELYGTTYSGAFNFGPVANDLYMGDYFRGPAKSVAAFMSAGNPNGAIRVALPGLQSVTVVSPFGQASVYPVTNGILALPVTELPTYVEMPVGQPCSVIQPSYGQNVALQSGVAVSASGGATTASPSLITNGVLESWYYNSIAPWTSNVTQWPATVEIDLPQSQAVSDVLIFAGVPWQNGGTLLDYDLQYWNGAGWSEIQHVVEPANTFPNYTPPVACTVDSFFSDRWVFEHHFAPVTTQKLRLVVNSVTYGGGATVDVVNAGGQTGPQQIVLREVEIFNAPAAASREVSTGQAVTFTASAMGTAPFNYQWYFNGAMISGATSASLTIANVKSGDAGNYFVIVTDASGTSSSNAYGLSVAQSVPAMPFWAYLALPLCLAPIFLHFRRKKHSPDS